MMKASEFAVETGIDAASQRNMRRRGLFPYGTRLPSGRYVYSADDVNKALDAISLRTQLGMSLEKAIQFSMVGRTHQILLAALGDYQLKAA